jgi:tryptophan halogenase
LLPADFGLVKPVDCLGQGVVVAVADTPGPAKTRGEVDEMEKSIRYLVQQMPGHGDYLARYCPAPIAGGGGVRIS